MTQETLIKVTKTTQRKKISYEGGVIRYFAKTPSNIICPHFWELNWAYGCRFECAYCYLQGTFHGRSRDYWHRPIEQILSVLDKFFKDHTNDPQILNSGELTDSLVYPQLMKKISDKFEEQKKHKLLLLTKSGNVRLLLDKPRKQSIFSFSMNAPEVAKRWEHKTPSPEKRVEAAKDLSELGNEVRIRIDPIFPIENWQMHYGDFVNLLLSKLPTDPDRITLGTPRGLQMTLKFSKDRSWIKFFTENPDKTGWGRKIPIPQRKEIYLFLYDKLSEYGFDKSKIAICKETKDMWSELGLDYKKCRCNCIW